MSVLWLTEAEVVTSTTAPAPVKAWASSSSSTPIGRAPHTVSSLTSTWAAKPRASMAAARSAVARPSSSSRLTRPPSRANGEYP